MDAEEQNTEAYLKGGQLYFRTIRDISQGEELLVWYDEELSHLLGFSDIKARALTVGKDCSHCYESRMSSLFSARLFTNIGYNNCGTLRMHWNAYGCNYSYECIFYTGYSCGKCGQEFKHENPFLAHCRFLCAQVKADAWRGDGETRRQRSVTDFHNIARDMEHKKSSEDRKRRHDEALSPRCRKPVLLEKKNMANHNNMTHVHREYPHDQDFMAPTMKVSSSPSSKLKSAKSSAFAEIKKAKSDQPSRAEDITRENPSVSTLQLDRKAGLGLQSDSSAFLLWSAHAEQKSAFCKPSKLSITEDQQHQRPAGPSDEVSEHAALGYRNMLASHLFQGDLSSTQTVSPTAPLSAAGSFHYAPEVWCRNISGPLQPTSSLTLLPPTLSSLGVTVQNWCAKCNLSFRMTSDLVFHMRSHHKKEFAAEAQGRRRREEKLTCPICHEYFRERHHLSRHMTSHN